MLLLVQEVRWPLARSKVKVKAGHEMEIVRWVLTILSSEVNSVVEAGALGALSGKSRCWCHAISWPCLAQD